MLCCLVCLKGTPVPGSKLSAFYTNTDQFQIGVMESCWKNCPWMHLMDKFKLQPDPWDNRVIHLKECSYNTLGWICIVGDACFEGFGALLLILDLVADLFYISGVGCMTAQMINEMQHRGSNAPSAATIVGR